MPYIDRDNLTKELSTMYKSPTSAEDFMAVGYDHAIADVVVTAYEQPTADVVDKALYKRLLENSVIIAAALNSYQSADMVEVVRCKDCKYRDDGGFCLGRGYPEQLVSDDGYCDNGERKEVENG